MPKQQQQAKRNKRAVNKNPIKESQISKSSSRSQGSRSSSSSSNSESKEDNNDNRTENNNIDTTPISLTDLEQLKIIHPLSRIIIDLIMTGDKHSIGTGNEASYIGYLGTVRTRLNKYDRSHDKFNDYSKPKQEKETKKYVIKHKKK
jgi:hypothetical protein